MNLSRPLYLLLRSLLVLLPLPVRAAAAQPALPFPLPVPLPGVERYAPSIPLPEAVIGHRVGTAHTEPHDVVAYFRAVDAASDRVVVAEHARSYEGRPLLHAVVTSPENHARLEALRQANLRLSEAPEGVSDAALAAMPVVVYMGYSIHGNEASGTEAALLLLYHLAAGDGPAVRDVLDRAVVIVEPMFNPDGRGRFTTWANRNRGAVAVTDPQDREHDEPWPGGRTNHYWFDLNRDWLPAQHPESQGRLALFHAWCPQLLTDHHEMGGDQTFFFQPGIPSRNNPNTPAATYALTAEIAGYHARALDRIGSLYFTEESFDDFYYGKGSTYPDVNGGVGILFEQASSRALQTETRNGVLTYAFTVRNQFTASLSTLEAAVAMREKLLRHMRDFYAGAPRAARESPVRAYVFGQERDPARAQLLAQLLRRHRIRVHALARDLEAGGAAFRAGRAFVVPVDQPQARLVKAVMERVTTFTDSLFYDISSWTLPLAFGVDHAELTRDAAAYVGPALETVELAGGTLVGGPSGYGYLLPWGRYFAPRALYKLLSAGVRPRLLTAPFEAAVGGARRAFDRGTVFIPVVQDGVVPDTVHAVVRRVVAEDHVDVYAVASGLTMGGPDLGSGGGQVLERPRLALLTGEGVNSAEAGEVWHLLSERFRFPVSLLDVDAVEGADLSRYNTLILPGGSYRRLPVEKVRAWVRDGGRLLALTDAVGWAVQNGLAELERKPFDLDSLLRDVPYARLEASRGAHQLGGSIFEVKLDVTHPLAFGFGPTLPVFRERTAAYQPSRTPGTTVGVYSASPLLSGYLSEPVRRQLAGSAALVARRFGRGSVILYLDDPNFRAFWYGTNGLFLNGLFFGGSF